MKNGKYSKRRSGISSKALVLTLVVMLIVGCTVGGTLAWLTDDTTAVKNTFTTSDVDIELEEKTGNSYQMVPGSTITKDPVVTVKANSEKAYVFVKVEESKTKYTVKGEEKTFGDYLSYEMDTNWKTLDTDNDGKPDVYYQVVDKQATDKPLTVIKDNKVTVKGTVTKDMMDAVTAGSEPTLTFTAYACQYYKSNTPTTDDAAGTPFTPAEAWNNCPKA